MNNFLSIERGIDSIKPDIIFNIAGYPMSNSTLSILLIMVFLIILSVLVIRRFTISPKKVQVVIEMIYEGLVSFISQLAGNKSRAERLIPIIGSIFVFILASNLLGSIPILGNITFDGKSIFRSPTSDFNTTFSIAFGALVIIQIMSIKDFGLLGYLGRFFKFKEVFMGFRESISKGMTGLIEFFVGLLDIVGELAKLVSLPLRLFGNMYAGLVLGVVMTSIFAYVLPSIFVALGLLTAVVQAIVFSSLITIYYIMSLKS